LTFQLSALIPLIKSMIAMRLAADYHEHFDHINHSEAGVFASPRIGLYLVVCYEKQDISAALTMIFMARGASS
jgi:hypothetical protein